MRCRLKSPPFLPQLRLFQRDGAFVVRLQFVNVIRVTSAVVTFFTEWFWGCSRSNAIVFSMASIFYIPFIMALATLWLYVLIANVPEVRGVNSTKSLSFPSNLTELKQLTSLLTALHREHKSYVYAIFTSAYLYKQTFAIPGSFFMNVLSGALFGLNGGLILVALLNAFGASFCYLLSQWFGKDYVIDYFPERVASLQKKVEENKHQLFYYLLFIRLFPMTPNWFINIASPILNIPLHMFFLSVFLGLIPYNFTCVQTGAVLSQITSLDDIFSYSVIFKLFLIALFALIPSFFIKNRKKRKSRSK